MRQTKLYGVARNNKIEIKRFAKFAVVGLSGLFVDYLVLNVLTYFLNFGEALAIAIAFICAAGNNFIWNRLWVYPESRTEKKRHQMPIFLGVNAVGLGINELIFVLFNPLIDAALAAAPIVFLASHHQGIGLNLTKGIAAVVVMFWNYFINRRVTFRNVSWQNRDGGSDGDMSSAL
jgi:putative flippase GtrA